MRTAIAVLLVIQVTALAALACLPSDDLVPALLPIFASTIYGLARILIKTVPEHHKVIEEKVSERTSELVEMMTRYEQAAMTDALTGLLNRRGGEQSIANHIARSNRIGSPLSIILLDLDHFKKINDTHGHAVGDQVLEGTAKMVQMHLRASDFAVRWGGEEFLICLPDTDLAGAILVAEKLRLLIEKLDFETRVAVTASFGCAELGDGDFKMSLARADMQLYVAKSQGRNQVAPQIDKKDA